MVVALLGLGNCFLWWEMGEENRRPFRVLCLDGGGMRGVYTAAFLHRLASQFAKRRGLEALDIGRGFDLITGTSTGAIVACALALGKPMSEVVTLYEEKGPSIFPHRIGGLCSAIYRALTFRYYVRKGDAALRSALLEVLQDRTMADVLRYRGISLAIPTVLMGTHRAWVFKKTANSGNRDDDYPLVDVCLASTAAPIYRSLAAIPDPNRAGTTQVFADGGLWANNPVLVGLIDALDNAEPSQPIELFSLGTCPRPEGEKITGDAVHRSMLAWRLGADVAPLSISAQEFAFDNMARLISRSLSKCGRSVQRVRFPTRPVPHEMMPFLGLDDSRREAVERLIEMAHDGADMTLSACDDPNNAEGKLTLDLMNSLPEMPKAGIDWSSLK